MDRRLATIEAGTSGDVRRRRRGLLPRALLVVAVVCCAALGFGLSQHDAAALRSFTDAVDRWQGNPEFRSLAADYSIRGSEALRTRPLLVPANRLIIVARSCPLLPERYGLTPTCRAHYEDFSRGPLCAYLHLCDEQAINSVVGMVEDLGQRCREAGEDAAPDGADRRAFRGPVKRDAGGVA